MSPHEPSRRAQDLVAAAFDEGLAERYDARIGRSSRDIRTTATFALPAGGRR